MYCWLSNELLLPMFNFTITHCKDVSYFDILLFRRLGKSMIRFSLRRGYHILNCTLPAFISVLFSSGKRLTQRPRDLH